MNRTNHPLFPSILKVGFLIVAMPMLGCAPKLKPSPAVAPVASGKPVAAPVNLSLEPHAMERLKAMGDTLAKAGKFSFTSTTSVEVPAKTGQYLTFFKRADVAVERPNKFSMNLAGDQTDYQVVYDGTRVFGYDPEKKLYALTKAPQTIDETLQFLGKNYGIHFHTADLMVSNPYSAVSQGLVSAFTVGTSAVDGVPCEHLAFMGQGINWEVWVETGRNALPRRFAVTYTDARNFPRFMVAVRDWNLKPTLNAARFKIDKPANAAEIGFGSPEARKVISSGNAQK